MASNTTNLDLVKQANNENWSNDIHNSNLEKIDAYVGKHNLGSFATISALEDALNALGATMKYGDCLDIYFTMTAAVGIFSATGYIGRIMKVLNAVRYRVIVYQNGGNVELDGVQWGGDSWVWESVQKRLLQKIVNVGSYAQTTANAWENTGITIVVPSGHVYVGMLTSGYSSGRPLGIAVDRSANPSGNMMEQSAESANGQYSVSVFLYPGTWYIFTKRASVATSANNYYFRYVDMYA